jgi:hypothetical protein
MMVIALIYFAISIAAVIWAFKGAPMDYRRDSALLFLLWPIFLLLFLLVYLAIVINSWKRTK